MHDGPTSFITRDDDNNDDADIFNDVVEIEGENKQFYLLFPLPLKTIFMIYEICFKRQTDTLNNHICKTFNDRTDFPRNIILIRKI